MSPKQQSQPAETLFFILYFAFHTFSVEKRLCLMNIVYQLNLFSFLLYTSDHCHTAKYDRSLLSHLRAE